MKILIIQTAFLGDVVLTTPLVVALKNAYPDAEIHLVSTPAGCAVLANTFSNFFSYILDKKKSRVQTLFTLKKQLSLHQPFDLILCPHRSLRSLFICKMLAAKRKIAFHSWWAKLLQFETVRYPQYSENWHYSAKLLELLGPLGLPRGTTRLQPFLAFAKPAPKLSEQEYIVLSPFSEWGTKMWFSERYARLAQALYKEYQLPIYIVGQGSGLQYITAQTMVEKASTQNAQVISLFNKTNLDELKAIIAGAKLVVSNDSAAIHIAAAFDTPTLAIFGPTVKKLGFFPLAQKSKVVETAQLACRPCSLHGPMRCPKKHFKCMDSITVDQVLEQARTLL